jgi:ATP-dependent 26S proteasome regulatory subunit
MRRLIGVAADLSLVATDRYSLMRADANAWVITIPGLIDAAVIGCEIWTASAGDVELKRIGLDGVRIGDIPLPGMITTGRWQTSAFVRAAVWQAETPWAVREDGPVALPPAEIAAPVTDGRWLIWRNGHASLWRSTSEVWRAQLGDTTSLVDAAALFEGRLVALCLRERAGQGLRLLVLGVRDGAVFCSLRLTGVKRLRIAPRRGTALIHVAEQVIAIDLRLGRVLREIAVGPDLEDFVVDETMQAIGILVPDGMYALKYTDFERGLVPSGRARPGPEADAAAVPADNGTAAEHHLAEHRPAEHRFAEGSLAEHHLSEHHLAEPASDNGESPRVAVVAEVPEVEPVEPPPLQPRSDHRPATGPLWGFSPHEEWPLAGALEGRRSLEARLDLLGARVWSAIADAWDCGRISQPDSREPPFAAEVAGILRHASGRAAEQLAAARAHVAQLEAALAAIDVPRGKRLIPLEVLGRQFGLSPLAVSILLTVAGPHLRGDYARLYGVLMNDPARALCDELLVTHILGVDKTDAIARELERDRPLRRYGLISVAPDAPSRLFAPLGVDLMVVRIIRGGSPDVDADPHLRPRVADRTVDQVRVPRAILSDAITALSVATDAPARIVVRGRAGSGRRTLLAALAGHAGRALGVIDLGGAPREPGRLLELLRASLRRALMRGWIPCVDGLDFVSDDDASLRDGIATILRDHPGPLALRLPPLVRAPLDPGCLALDLPVLDERERQDAWNDALARRGLSAADSADLAARYRVGPGVIERVTAAVGEAFRIAPGAEPDTAAATAAVNTAVRQHLESRIGDVATRVRRQATWSDVVLPEDLVDSLLEITGRVRYRKKVFEDWGYGRSITTSRGITALFSGGPGTGKTMVAGVIARDLGVELYRVDVSRITSKWVGETEKNLASLFDAAEDGQVMLLFDEADSLFAKRTNVQTSVDRYANMEVNYLLQRLDSFEGIAILTTNFGSAIDPAFRRRLSFRVTFPFPDEEMRERLWRALIPSEVPRVEAIDFSGLATRFKLSGGYIRNASLRAAFLAAEEGLALTQDHIERAIRAEFREIGKLADTGMLE